MAVDVGADAKPALSLIRTLSGFDVEFVKVEVNRHLSNKIVPVKPASIETAATSHPTKYIVDEIAPIDKPPPSWQRSNLWTPVPVVETVVRPSIWSPTILARVTLLPIVKVRPLESDAIVPPKSCGIGPTIEILFLPDGIVTPEPA
jgi:hypothetical protein